MLAAGALNLGGKQILKLGILPGQTTSKLPWKQKGMLLRGRYLKKFWTVDASEP